MSCLKINLFSYNFVNFISKDINYDGIVRLFHK